MELEAKESTVAIDNGNSESMKTAQIEYQNSMESYNGARRDSYSWSQSLTEVEVYVSVPETILKGKQLRVETNATHMEVDAALLDTGTNRTEWKNLVSGELTWKVNTSETLWTLVPGKHVQIHLEKCQERWWDALLVDEPKIDLKLIDARRPMEELAQDEQMKIAELVWQDEQKRKGLPTATSVTSNVEEMLKDAWDRDGSPFKGTPYDPSIVQFQNAPDT